MFHLDGAKLRVLRKFSLEPRNKAYLEKTRLIVLEHLLPTTEEMLNLLNEAGSEIFCVIAKPYSIDAGVLNRLESKGQRIIKESYETLEQTSILHDLIIEALEKCNADDKRLVLLDVGGYFAEPLKKITTSNAPYLKYLSGVVEDTTFGHNRYIKSALEIKTPIYSVARSKLKEIEARFVGHDAVKAVDLLLRKVGVSLVGRNALVIGYGMIGKNVARTLRAYDAHVHVYDKLDSRNLEAFIDGFIIQQKRELLKHADVIFCATGDAESALNIDELLELKQGVALVSVGSKDTEFDIKNLKQQAIGNELIDGQIIRYTTNNSKKIVVIREGTAVNFYLPSIPIEVLDLVFSEIFICMMRLLKTDVALGSVLEIEETALQPISHDWLRFVVT